ncbi:hypothetical protein AVEN_26501-1 [Araneus ventricosus]|uniref:Uncharacterized protein n=1 Tax=Araneus ventricosus TaxID=182803 RepID=A0A4Y2CUA2_ARAVE|nr:hypothetical protein AVEN_26501-1 [Araneus ventricosus]
MNPGPTVTENFTEEGSASPHLGIVGLETNTPKFYVLAENQIVLQLSTLSEALAVLVASYYIFHCEYPKQWKKTLLFLESFIFEMHNTHETDFETKLKQHVALLLLQAQEKHMLPLSTTQKLLQDFNSLCEMQTDYIPDKIKTNIVSLGITADCFLKLNNILKENYISKSIDSLSTNYKRMHYYETELQTVFPIEYTLGSNIFNKTCSFQYVSVLSTLKFLLMQDDVFQQVINPIGNSDNNVVSSFNDGQFAKSHLLFSTNQEALQINMFCDEFEVCNPLGVHRKTHKILAFYYILGNIYPEFRSCVDNIQLSILVKSTYAKKFGINMIVEPLIKDLNILASHGISVRDKTFVGSLSFISGDNLGSNMIGGFVESFSNKVNYYCRTCLCTKTEVQNVFSDENISLRTPQNYEQHVTELLTDIQRIACMGLNTVLHLIPICFM